MRSMQLMINMLQAAFTVLGLLRRVRWLAVVEEKGAFVSNEAQLRA